MNDKSNSVVLDDQDLYIIEVATSAQPGDFPITKGGICPLPHGACFPGEVGRGLHPGAGASRSRDTVGWVHDKHAMRARLRAVGLEDTAAALVTDREMLHAFAAKHGLPLVVKPNGGVASVGVSVARTPADLDACFATAVAEHGAFSSPGVLAERFFEGPQFSIEGRSSTRSGCEESGPDPDVTVAAHAQPGARLDGLRDNYSRLAEARAFAPDPEQALAMARDAIGKLRIVVHAPPADPDCF